jgi:hypothetical protein
LKWFSPRIEAKLFVVYAGSGAAENHKFLTLCYGSVTLLRDSCTSAGRKNLWTSSHIQRGRVGGLEFKFTH